jgi:predicted ribosome quality control (RQC) complex YloA/Tae2 family protein
MNVILKKKLYKTNVLFAPRDQILVPAKEVFDEIIKKTMFQRLIDFRRIDLNTHHNKQIIPTPYNNYMDLLANEYYVIGTTKDSLVVNKLKKKLRRHRLRHLKEKKVLKNIDFPKTELGDSVKTLLSVLNTEPRQRRSRRKKINKAIRKKKTKIKNQIKQNRLQRLKNEALVYERRESRLKKLKENKEALLYLERLKTFEKACKGSDLNPLDILFSPFEK